MYLFSIVKKNTITENYGFFKDEDDDCSIFKRLTRKCNCLNQMEYNDFVIHFNEDTKYFTSTIGEIIKNMRILKKFLYMGGRYTQNALIFLNEVFIFNLYFWYLWLGLLLYRELLVYKSHGNTPRYGTTIRTLYR